MATVHKKLMQARLQLQAMEIKKSGENKFAGYRYMELGDFTPAIQKICADLGLCGTVSFTAELATLTMVDADSDDDKSILFTSPMGSAALKGCHEVQNIGAVETYQRRYLWQAAFEIVEHDSLDASDGPELNPNPRPRKKQEQPLDMSPKARADRIRLGVASGDAVGAAKALSGFEKEELDAVWALLPVKTQEQLTAVWPKE